MYVVMNRNPINNHAAFMLMCRCEQLGVKDRYFSEYSDNQHTNQFVAVGPVSPGDAKSVYDIMSAAKGEPMKLQEVNY